MSIPNRTVSITGVFAESALTTIPQTPVAGVSYRDTNMTPTDVENGWSYKTIVDSAQFNQALYQYSSVTAQIEKYGFLPWSNLTDYVQGSFCLGSDGNIYKAKQATGPSTTAFDPVNDTSHTYWDDYIGENYVTLATDQTITGNKNFTGNIEIQPLQTTGYLKIIGSMIGSHIRISNTMGNDIYGIYMYNYSNSTRNTYDRFSGSSNCNYRRNIQNGTYSVGYSFSLNSSGISHADFSELTYVTLPDPVEDTSTSTQADTVGARNVKINKLRSNCIDSIPQNIKLELSSGTLTLKAGSKIYVPNGSDVFNTVTVPSDIVFHSGTIGSGSGEFMIFCNSSGGFGARTGTTAVASGSTDPGSGYNIWYDTTNNQVKYSANADGSWSSGYYSLPIGIYQRTNGNATAINNIFNGFGFIGNSMYVLPDVGIVSSNGFNSDGSLKNIYYKTTEVKVTNITNDAMVNGYNYVTLNNGNYKINLTRDYDEVWELPTSPRSNTTVYLIPENTYYGYSSGTWIKSSGLILVGTITGNSSGKISSLKTKTVFYALDRNDLPYIWSQSASNTSGNNPSALIEEGTGYIKYSSGVMIQWGILNETSQFPLITLNKPYVNENYIGIVSPQAGGTADRAATSIYNYTTTSFQARIQNTSAGQFRWMTIGMWK